MPTRSIDPATLTFAQSLVRIKAKQLARVIPSPAVNNRKDLEQELLLEVAVRWSRFNPSRGSAEAFVERVVERKLCKLLRDAKRAKRGPRAAISLSCDDSVDERDSIRETCIRADVRGVMSAMTERDRRVCDQLLRETVSEAARQLRTPRATLEYAVDRIRTQMRKAEIHEYLS